VPTLSDDADAAIKSVISGAGKDVFLLADDKETVTFELGPQASKAKVLRVDRSLIRALLFEHVSEANFYSTFVVDFLTLQVTTGASKGSASSPSGASAASPMKTSGP
jgi:hypothetical protein